VPKEEVLEIFATAPALDVDELYSELRDGLNEDVRDPYAGTGL
jgi:hypothetical protein